MKKESKTKRILVVVVNYMYRHHENALFLFLPILVGVVGEYALYYTPKNEPHVHELGRMLTVQLGICF